MKLPVIICPLSRTGDESAGETPDQVAVNLAAGTRIALSFRKKPVRPCPDVWKLFRGYRLSEEAKTALRFVTEVYGRFKRADEPRREVVQPETLQLELIA